MSTRERELITRLIDEDPNAWEIFVNQYSDLIYSHCRLIFSEAEVGPEYLKVLSGVRANRFALLRPFDGRAKLTTYLTFKLCDLLGIRIVELLNEDSLRAWKAFECFFQRDIEKAIANCFLVTPSQNDLDDGTRYEDLYQEIWRRLIEDGGRRLRSYNGSGTFGAFVRTILQHLCADLFRKWKGRRRLPASIARLPLLEQEVFKLLYWEECSREEILHQLRGKRWMLHSREMISEAMDRVHEAIGSKVPGSRPKFESMSAPVRQNDGSEREFDIADSDSSPFEVLTVIEEKQAKRETLCILADVVKTLPEKQYRYVQLHYYRKSPMKPAQIAAEMGCSREEIYKLGAEVMAVLATELRARGVKKS